MSDSQTQAIHLSPSVQEKLAAVLQYRNEIVSVLRETVNNDSGSRKKRSLALAKFFQQTVSADDLVRRPDALSLCLGMVAPASTGHLERWQIEDAVHSGLDRQNESRPMRGRLVGALVYPLVLLFLCLLLLIVGCVFLVPEFQQMFDEFGLTLPPVTAFVFGLAEWIRAWGWVSLFSLVVIGVVLWVASMLGSGGWDHGWFKKCSGVMTSSRAAWAAWAWHAGLLLETGLSPGESFALAGNVSSKSTLRQSAGELAMRIDRGSITPAEVFACFRGPPCHLLVYAVQLNDHGQQAGLLQDVATIYWDRARGKGQWWFWWLTPVTVCLVRLMIGMVVSALLMPMLELINGLV